MGAELDRQLWDNDQDHGALHPTEVEGEDDGRS
jgi:hypothetical protein